MPALLSAGCAGQQSALDPAGPSAAAIHQLGLVMYVGAAAVTLLVTVLMLVPFLRRRARPGHARLFLWGGGVALPLLSLTLLVPYVLSTGHETRVPAADRLTIDVTGHLWWWEVSYRRGDGAAPARTANELRLPAGQPVELLLHAQDVIHSFWVPNLAGKTDMIPGRINRMVIQADRPGVYRGQCAEYCGTQHALMAFDVIVLPRDAFDAWLARLAAPAARTADGGTSPRARSLRRHGLRRLPRRARRERRPAGPGPDAGRRAALARRGDPSRRRRQHRRLDASAQHLKPGNAMPSYDQLEGPQLRALAAYLGSLQ